MDEMLKDVFVKQILNKQEIYPITTMYECIVLSLVSCAALSSQLCSAICLSNDDPALLFPFTCVESIDIFSRHLVIFSRENKTNKKLEILYVQYFSK